MQGPNENGTAVSPIDLVLKFLQNRFSFINRDFVAKAILNVDNVYENSSTILVVSNQIVNLSSFLLKALPLGPVLPFVIQALFALILSPPTRLIVKILLFRLWELIPKNPADHLVVSMPDGWNVVVRGPNNSTASTNFEATNEIIPSQTTAEPSLLDLLLRGK